MATPNPDWLNDLPTLASDYEASKPAPAPTGIWGTSIGSGIASGFAGLGGDVARTRILDVSGSMKVTVMQTGITNDRLMALRNADRIANAGVTSFMFKDLNGNTLAMAPDLWIKKTPSVKRQGKDLENVEWEFEFGHGEIDIGGQIPIPTD